MLIGLSLAALLVIAMFNSFLGADFSDYTVEGDYGQTMGIDEVEGAIVIIIVLIALVVLVGIQVVGSGLSDTSGKAVMTLVAYISVWGIFSTLSYDLIISIEAFGTIIYLILTIMYAVGVIQQLTGSD